MLARKIAHKFAVFSPINPHSYALEGSLLYRFMAARSIDPKARQDSWSLLLELQIPKEPWAKMTLVRYTPVQQITMIHNIVEKE